MRFLALACSYDETIARDGRVDPATTAALRRLIASGRQLILLSRRSLDELRPTLRNGVFEWVVAEYGGVLYHPATGRSRLLTDPLPRRLAEAAAEHDLGPVHTGQTALITRSDRADALRELLRQQDLDLQVVVDKDAALALPHGVSKVTGLAAALADLGLSFHNVVGCGDAESDLDMLARCECSVAVANAPAAVRDRCDLVTEGAAGAGVVELIDQLTAHDLAELEPRLARHRLLLGHRPTPDTPPGRQEQRGEQEEKREEVRVRSYPTNLLLAGPSGTGKSKLASGLLERLAEQGYQFCVLDPEGDYDDFPHGLHLGDRHAAPTVEEVAEALAQPDQCVIVNLLGRRLDDLPAFLAELLPDLQDLRTRTGRPHLLLLDEAHHFLPLPTEPGAFVMPRWVDGLIMATVNPEHISPTALSLVDVTVTFGDTATSTLERYCEAIGETPPPDCEVGQGQALAWLRRKGHEQIVFEIAPGPSQRRPHLRRYEESELDDAKSFTFRGPEGQLRLRARTLRMFIQMGEGVDDDTWLYHLRRGDYSKWFRDGIRDEDLAETVAKLEQDRDRSADESRLQVFTSIKDRYLRS